MAYTYKGSLVTIVNDLGSLVMIQLPDKSRTTVARDQLKKINDNAVIRPEIIQSSITPKPAQRKNQPQSVETNEQLSFLEEDINDLEEETDDSENETIRIFEREDDEDSETSEDDDNESESENIDTSDEEEFEKVNINTLTYEQFIELKGIGKISARKILDNKPSKGYSSLEQLIGINGSLNRVSWDTLDAQVTFELID